MIYELSLPGAPLIGWHFDCEDGDPLFIRLTTTSGAGNVAAAAVRIGRRGQDRVIARKAWWDLFTDDDAQGVGT